MSVEPLAIIGLSGRFPGARDVEAYWRLLRDGVDAITEIPPGRWDVDALFDPDPSQLGKIASRWGGFLDQVDQFDAGFFGFTPEEISLVDPQQRIVLEVAWEALEDAGQAPNKLAGSQTGVFVAISTFDYYQALSRDLTLLNAYSATGNHHSIAANRISYLLDLRGPSLTVDTACSSSLVAVHLACQSLWTGESDLALAGGVNLVLGPELTVGLSRARLMAPDGRCKTFDAAADGYVRSEGCGMILLKRLSEARRNGDPIRAILRGSAVNQDGLTTGLMAPKSSAQRAVIQKAWKVAAVPPTQMSYFEAHGSGTPLGDTIEVKSLKAVLMQDPSPDQQCWIGSVKANIGHLEAAAGIAGLIKVVLALEHQEIPPHPHFKKVNPLLKLEGTPLKISPERLPWPASGVPRRAGVSSFGFGGTNCHVVLEEAESPAELPPAAPEAERPLHLLALSAKSEAALKELAHRWAAALAAQPATSLADICFTANTGRSHFAHRLAVICNSSEQLKDQLTAFAAGETVVGVVSGQAQSSRQPKIAFLFSGEEAAYPSSLEALYAHQPTFRQTLDTCRSALGDETAKPPAALFAIEYALTELWRSWGIKPDAVLGYGVGNYVAAWAAGVFSLEDGLKLMTHHVRHEAALPTVTLAAPRLKLISSLTGQLVTEMNLAEGTNGQRPALEAAHAATAIQTLRDLGCELFIEIGPGPNLLAGGRDVLPEGQGVWLPALQKDGDEWEQMLRGLGRVYAHGVEVDWAGFDRDYQRNRLRLPTYPFQRQRHWLPDKPLL